MNETQTPRTRTPEPQTPEPISPETQSIAKQRSLADRILAYSVIGSVLVNFGWLAWVSNSNLFGGANVAELTPKLLKIVKPPIPQKPKPKKKEKPPPPPPKQHIIPPKIRPLKPPPPHQTPRPRPQRVQPPLHRMAVAATTNTHAVSNIVAPPSDPNPTVGTPTASGEAREVTPPAPAPPPPTPPTPEPPAPKPDPPAPVVHHDPPPPPPPPPPPKPKIPDRDEPAIIGSISDISLPEFDPSTLNTTSVTVTWEVDERGHPSNIKFRPTGNSDVDSAIRNAVQGFRFKPAVHNGVAETAQMSHTFALGS